MSPLSLPEADRALSSSLELTLPSPSLSRDLNRSAANFCALSLLPLVLVVLLELLALRWVLASAALLPCRSWW